MSSSQAVVSFIVDTGCHRTQLASPQQRAGNFIRLIVAFRSRARAADLTLSDRRSGRGRAGYASGPC
jgi:hypothetical protein